MSALVYTNPKSKMAAATKYLGVPLLRCIFAKLL